MFLLMFLYVHYVVYVCFLTQGTVSTLHLYLGTHEVWSLKLVEVGGGGVGGSGWLQYPGVVVPSPPEGPSQPRIPDLLSNV